MAIINDSIYWCHAENKLAEADSLMTWLPDGAVKLRMTDNEPGSRTPVTVMTVLNEVVGRVPDRIALGEFHSVYYK